MKGNALEAGEVRPLFGPVMPERGYLHDVSADGQRFLVALDPKQQASAPLTLLENWTALLAASFGKSEQSAKEDISGEELERKLGIARDAETVDVEDKGQVFLQREILGRATPFAASGSFRIG